MGQRIVQGGTATLSAYFRDGVGQLVTPVDPFVSITDPGGTVVVSLATPTEVTTGFYQYQFPVPVSADLGGWGALWFGVVDGAAVDDDDVFTVVAPGTIEAGTAFVTVDDLENYMQRTLTALQRQAASVLIGEVIAEAEWKMGNGIGAATYEEDIQLDPYTSFVPLKYGPVVSVSTVDQGGSAWAASSYEVVSSGLALFGPTVAPVTGSSSILFPALTVTYLGGITDPGRVAVLANVVKGRVARVMTPIMNQAIDATSISVEGYSVNLMEDDWTPREARILLSRRSRVRGTVIAPPPPLFTGSGGSSGYGADLPPDG